MGCVGQMNRKIKIHTIPFKITSIKEKKDINNDDQIQIYQKADSVLNCQTNISQNVQYLIDNNPIPFVKIKKKIKT